MLTRYFGGISVGVNQFSVVLNDTVLNGVGVNQFSAVLNDTAPFYSSRSTLFYGALN